MAGRPVPGRLRVCRGVTAEVRSLLRRLVAVAGWHGDGDAAVLPLPGEGALRLPCAAWAVVLLCALGGATPPRVPAAVAAACAAAAS